MLFGSALGALEDDDKTRNTASKNKVTLQVKETLLEEIPWHAQRSQP